jgi:hypothetical protein
MEAQGGDDYSSYSFTTSALDGVSSQRHALAALYPQGNGQEARWVPEPVWTQKKQKNPLACAGDRTSITMSSSP